MTIEQQPESQGEEIQEKISRLKDDFQDWLQENPDAGEKLKIELLQAAGISEDELVYPPMGFDMGFVKVSIKDLPSFGTSCGDVGNKVFSSNEVSGFLKDNNVEFIIGIGDNNEPVVFSVAMEIPKEGAERLSEVVDDNGGSLRPESSKVDGWSIFESE